MLALLVGYDRSLGHLRRLNLAPPRSASSFAAMLRTRARLLCRLPGGEHVLLERHAQPGVMYLFRAFGCTEARTHQQLIQRFPGVKCVGFRPNQAWQRFDALLQMSGATKSGVRGKQHGGSSSEMDTCVAETDGGGSADVNRGGNVRSVLHTTGH